MGSFLVQLLTRLLRSHGQLLVLGSEQHVCLTERRLLDVMQILPASEACKKKCQTRQFLQRKSLLAYEMVLDANHHVEEHTLTLVRQRLFHMDILQHILFELWGVAAEGTDWEAVRQETFKLFGVHVEQIEQRVDQGASAGSIPLVVRDTERQLATLQASQAGNTTIKARGRAQNKKKQKQKSEAVRSIGAASILQNTKHDWPLSKS